VTRSEVDGMFDVVQKEELSLTLIRRRVKRKPFLLGQDKQKVKLKSGR